MHRIEGDRDLALPQSEAWNRLSDLRFLIRCIPDVEAVKTVEAHHAEFAIRPGFSFVRGKLDVTARITEATAPNSVQMSLASKGIGSSSTIEAALSIAPADANTRVHWVVDIKELGGLLKMVPQGLILGAARKVIEDAWNAVAARITLPPTPPA